MALCNGGLPTTDILAARQNWKTCPWCAKNLTARRVPYAFVATTRRYIPPSAVQFGHLIDWWIWRLKQFHVGNYFHTQQFRWESRSRFVFPQTVWVFFCQVRWHPKARNMKWWFKPFQNSPIWIFSLTDTWMINLIDEDPSYPANHVGCSWKSHLWGGWPLQDVSSITQPCS